MNLTKLSILLALCLHVVAGAYAVDFSKPVDSRGQSGTQWATAQQPAMQMSSSSAYLTSRQSVGQPSFGSTMGAQPARSIMLDNLDNAFSGGEPGGLHMSTKRYERDEPAGPSDPPGMDTPVGEVPWWLIVVLAVGNCVYRRRRLAVMG